MIVHIVIQNRNNSQILFYNPFHNPLSNHLQLDEQIESAANWNLETR